MVEQNKKQHTQPFELTGNIITVLDLGRVLRELEKLNDELHQAALRKDRPAKMTPDISEALKGVASANKLNLENTDERKQLLEGLNHLKTDGPKLHISFAVEPPLAVMGKITAWLRQNIDPRLLMEVGVQPTISVGCVVRTTNKVFDLSLRSRFANSKQELIRLLKEPS